MGDSGGAPGWLPPRTKAGSKHIALGREKHLPVPPADFMCQERGKRIVVYVHIKWLLEYDLRDEIIALRAGRERRSCLPSKGREDSREYKGHGGPQLE